MVNVREKNRQKRQVGILLLSLTLVVGGMLWTWQIGMAANKLDHRLDHATDDLRELRQNIQQLEIKRK